MTLTVKDGYTRGKTSGTYRTPASIAEMISWCDSHSHITALDIHGMSRTVKVNGKVRTWKRDAGRVEVPYKYGMYEYGTFTADDLNRILIPV
jgi:hypothetical protein